MDKIKAFFNKYKGQLYTSVGVVLFGIVCFLFGRYTQIEREVPINISQADSEVIEQTSELKTRDNIDLSLGKYIGNLEGSIYYVATQAKIDEIGEENLIWFDSKEDAEEQGYQPAEQDNKEVLSEEDDVANVNTDDNQIVASKNGTKYYLITCSGVSRIKEENRVYFDSIEEAEAEGLEPAKNCPGLE